MSELETSPVDRRSRIGVVALSCLAIAILGLLLADENSAWPAAALRISIVLGSLWLCLPTAQRPAAWARLTRGRLAVIVLITVFINRLKFLLPALLIVGIAAWLIRPKKRR